MKNLTAVRHLPTARQAVLAIVFAVALADAIAAVMYAHRGEFDAATFWLINAIWLAWVGLQITDAR